MLPSRHSSRHAVYQFAFTNRHAFYLSSLRFHCYFHAATVSRHHSPSLLFSLVINCFSLSLRVLTPSTPDYAPFRAGIPDVLEHAACDATTKATFVEHTIELPAYGSVRARGKGHHRQSRQYNGMEGVEARRVCRQAGQRGSKGAGHRNGVVNRRGSNKITVQTVVSTTTQMRSPCCWFIPGTNTPHQREAEWHEERSRSRHSSTRPPGDTPFKHRHCRPVKLRSAPSPCRRPAGRFDVIHLVNSC